MKIKNSGKVPAMDEKALLIKKSQQKIFDELKKLKEEMPIQNGGGRCRSVIPYYKIEQLHSELFGSPLSLSIRTRLTPYATKDRDTEPVNH